jgi:hypothetical protein
MQGISWLAENRLASQDSAPWRKCLSPQDTTEQGPVYLMTEIYSVAGTLFEKPQTTNNGQIIVVLIVVLTSTIGFTFQCRPRTRYVALISNNARPGITNQNYNLHHKKIQIRNPHVNAPRVRHKKQNYMDSHITRGIKLIAIPTGRLTTGCLSRSHKQDLKAPTWPS